jgi:hypothetical protein
MATGSVNVTIPLGEGPACENCCNNSDAVQVVCRSLTGTAELCGYSANDDGSYDAGDPSTWNGNIPYARKWKKRILDGEERDNTGALDICGNNYDNFVFTWAGTAERDCDGVVSFATQNFNTYDVFACAPGPITSTDVEEYPFALSLTGSCGPTENGPRYTDSLTVRTITFCRDPAAYLPSPAGVLVETLDDEETFFTALGRSDPPLVEGDSCCAFVTASTETSPRSVSSVSRTGQAVQADLSFSGAVPDQCYIVKLLIFITDMDGLVLGSFLEVFDIVTDSLGAWSVTYTVPDPPMGNQYCVGYAWREICPA